MKSFNLLSLSDEEFTLRYETLISLRLSNFRYIPKTFSRYQKLVEFYIQKLIETNGYLMNFSQIYEYQEGDHLVRIKGKEYHSYFFSLIPKEYKYLLPKVKYIRQTI